MRAVPVTPRQVMFTVCGQCPSLHAEGLITASIVSCYLTCSLETSLEGTERVTVRPIDQTIPPNIFDPTIVSTPQSRCLLEELRNGPLVLNSGCIIKVQLFHTGPKNLATFPHFNPGDFISPFRTFLLWNLFNIIQIFLLFLPYKSSNYCSLCIIRSHSASLKEDIVFI